MFRFIICVLLFSASCFGQLTITAPQVVDCCSGLVQVDAATESGELAQGDVEWVFLNPPSLDHRELDGGTSIVFAAPPKPMTITIQCICWADKTFDTTTITVGGGGPVVDPIDPDPIVDPPAPPPMGEKFRVLIMDEAQSTPTAVTKSPEYRALITSAAQNGWRKYDDDFTDEQVSMMTPVWQAAYKRAKTDYDGKVPWIVVTDDEHFVSEPLADTVDEATSHIQQFVR